MKEVAKVQILGENLEILEGDARKPTELYEEISVDYSKMKAFGVKGDPAKLLVMPRSNEVEVKCRDYPRSTFSPQDGEIPSYRWEISFGNMPKDIKRKFGRPETLSVEFLGHQDRDVLMPLMAQQERSFNPNLVVPIHPENTGWRETIFITCPVFKANLYVLDSDPSEKDHPTGGFYGKAMFVGEVGCYPARPTFPQIKLSIATLGEDGLVRVDDRRDWVMMRKDLSLLDEVAQRLAKMSVFFRTLSSMRRPYSWLRDGFPLQILSGVYEFLEDGKRKHEGLREEFPFSWGQVLKERYHVDWGKILQDLSREEVALEKQRIKNFIENF